NLFEGSVLLRLFETGEDRELTNKIAEYTNSQNAISSIDLKSMDPLQIKIEKFLSNHNILYVRKVGDVGERERKYDQRISMEKLGQLLYALYGYQDRCSNQKKRIFLINTMRKFLEKKILILKIITLSIKNIKKLQVSITLIAMKNTTKKYSMLSSYLNITKMIKKTFN